MPQSSFTFTGEHPLKTATGKCAVVSGKKVVFKRQNAKHEPKWKVWKLRKGEAQGRICLVFVWHHRSEDHILIQNGNTVKLKRVPNFEKNIKEYLNYTECHFHWCNLNGNKGSLQCAAAKDLYLAIGKRWLIASTTAEPALFELI
ncbi:hypothetical protein AALO_G00164400 [Alosa alosa]|uniref:Uncharacterized protein n=1 Tax=Alosa alosa TaxID=278164 RepID=A0AAV6GE23_9TELE|nr:hypothetical protein AALO_G00164400 [Alosa alosa]